MKNRIARLAKVSAALLFSALASRADGETGEKIRPSDVPDIQAGTLDGSEFNLSNQRGKPVIIHFWATWCPACQSEMVMLSHYYKLHRSEGLELLAISLDRPRDRTEVLSRSKEFGFPIAMLGDVKMTGFKTPATLPVTDLIDRQGVVRAVFEAGEKELTEADLDAAIKRLPK